MVHYSLITSLLLCLIAFIHEAGSESAPADYSYHEILDPAGTFQLLWKFDEETITFQLHALTKGWAGIGFSPNGGMGGADLVVLWVDQSGKGFISDRHADHNGFPPEDEKQDYTLIDSAKNDTHLIVTFSRKRNTCDPDDWVLTEDTTRVIYASNDAIPESKDKFKMHSVRGSKSVHFFDEKLGTGVGVPPADTSAVPMEFRINKAHVPDNRVTTYWCEIMVAPKVAKKLHIIKVDPVIEQENIDVVHHIVVYACSKNMSSWVGKGRPCYGEDEDEELSEFNQCKSQVLAVWAVGGQGTTYPDDLGLPLKNDGQDMYVLMEMHYDNWQLKKGKVDSSGMRVWVTEKLRPIELGQAVFGLIPTPDQQVIPPGVKEFTNYGYCTAECSESLPKDGVKVFGGLLHTHLAGRKIRLLHLRNGTQLPPVLSDEHYDFNYQDNRHLSKPVTVLPGDQLIVECVYETLDRNKTTFGGQGTHDEMCIVFVDYYPGTHEFGCFSMPDKREMYKMFGIDFVPYNESDPKNTAVILPNGDHKNLSNYLKKDFNFNWTPEKIDQFQKVLRTVKHDVMCFSQGHNSTKNASNEDLDLKAMIEDLKVQVQHGYPNITKPLVVPDVCTEKKGGEMKNHDIDNGETHANRPVPQELREHNAGEKVHKHSLIFLSISIIAAFIYA